MAFRCWLWVCLVTVGDRLVGVNPGRSWSYFTEVKGSPIFKEYEVPEIDVWAAKFQCPKDYFISNLAYYFTTSVPHGDTMAPPQFPQGHPKAPPQFPQGHPKAPPQFPQGHPMAPPQFPHGHPKAPPQFPQGLPKAPPQFPQAHPMAPPQFPHGHHMAPPQFPHGHPMAPPQFPHGHPMAPPQFPHGHPMAPPQFPHGHPKAPPQFPHGHPKAPPQFPHGHPKAPPQFPQGLPKAPPQFPQGHPMAPPRPQNGDPRATPPVDHMATEKERLVHKRDTPNGGQVGQGDDLSATTASFALTMPDGLMTWHREHYRKSHPHHDPTHPANLAVKFNPGDDLISTLFKYVAEKDYIFNGSFPRTYGPCAPLVYCLGHQACVFRYSNEFCLQDPLPGKRKILKIQLECLPDKIFNNIRVNFDKSLNLVSKAPDLSQPARVLAPKEDTGVPRRVPVPPEDPLVVKYRALPDVLQYRLGDSGHLESWPDKVVFVKYLSQLEQGIKNYTNTSLLPLLIDEQEVFNFTCPSAQQAFQMGYWGECSDPQNSHHDMVDTLWSSLARTPVPSCRDELRQLTCAYSMNPLGRCLPPFLIDPRTRQWGLSAPLFTTVALPANGVRHDLGTYRQIYSHPHRGLIPVRLGFLIVAHSGAQAVLQLLQLLYRDHHYYVIHVDKRKDDVRNSIIALISAKFPNKENIRVLPKERSIAASWGSFQILRVELEGFEELIQMGVWDFSFILSGTDLPLRSVDDFAAVLAPYRGKNLVRINKKIGGEETPHSNYFWHTCDDHVFRVGQRKSPTDLEVYSHSAWTLLSREFTETVVSERRPLDMVRAQLYLMSTFIPDETYLGTLLFNSPQFSRYSMDRGMHMMKPFMGNNQDNLCRHSDVTDACGRGPSNFEMDDLESLQFGSHHFFFARKFSTDIDDPVRNNVMTAGRQDTYRRSLENAYSDNMIRALCEQLLERPLIPGTTAISSIEVMRTWRVVPTLHDEGCCTGYWPWRMNKPFRVIIDVVLRDESNHLVDARVSFLTRGHVACFPVGHLRSMYPSARPFTWEPHPTTVDLHAPPSPTQPRATGGLSIILGFDFHSRATGTCTDPPLGGKYFTVDPTIADYKPPHNPHGKPDSEPPHQKVPFMASLRDAHGRTVCNSSFGVDLVPPNTASGDAFALHRADFMNCTGISRGWYDAIVKENVTDAYEYTYPLYFADHSSPEAYDADVIQWLPELFKFEDLLVLTKHYDHKYYASRPLLPKTFDMTSESLDSEVPSADESYPKSSGAGRDTKAEEEMWVSQGSPYLHQGRRVGRRRRRSGDNNSQSVPLGLVYFIVLDIIMLGNTILFAIYLTKDRSLRSGLQLLLRCPRVMATLIALFCLQAAFYSFTQASASFVPLQERS